jgi:hypothetical protein
VVLKRFGFAFQNDEPTKLLRLKVISGHSLARKDIFGARYVFNLLWISFLQSLIYKEHTLYLPVIHMSGLICSQMKVMMQWTPYLRKRKRGYENLKDLLVVA